MEKETSKDAVITIKRDYRSACTIGYLFAGGCFVCYTLERPWMENRRNVSCIPEGCYVLAARTSKKFGQHLLVEDVPARGLILMHPANDAQYELRGCIAPVSKLRENGKGSGSRLAMGKVLAYFKDCMKRKVPVKLRITELAFDDNLEDVVSGHETSAMAERLSPNSILKYYGVTGRDAMRMTQTWFAEDEDGLLVKRMREDTKILIKKTV